MSDPAAGKFEFAGGHLEQGETARQAALREWQEETGLPFPDGEFTGTWTTPNGIYQGFVYTIAREADLDIFDRHLDSDPDGDVTGTEAIAWWDPADLAGNPAVRAELLASLPAVMAALAPPCCGRECCTDGCCGGAAGCQCAAPVAKAVSGSGPKAPSWPGWELDGLAMAYWSPVVAAAVAGVLTPEQLEHIAAGYLALGSGQDGAAPGKRDRIAAAAAYLAGLLISAGVGQALDGITESLVTDGALIGAASAAALATGQPVDTGGWQPGDAVAASDRLAALGASPGAALTPASNSARQRLSLAYWAALGAALAGAAAGVTAAALGASLAVIVADKATPATAVADTLTGSAAAAARDVYERLDVGYGEWVTDPSSRSGPCPACLANEAAGPVRIGASYPSGDAEPPIHPHCNCQIIPSAGPR